MLKDFRAFILRGNVVDLAVGIVIGAAFGTVVSAFVENVLTPVIAIPGSAPDMSSWAIHIGEAGPEQTVIGYGFVLNALISFVLVAAAVFFFVVRPVNTLMARYKTEPQVEQKTTVCPECLSSIPRDARRCAFCTSPIGEQAQPG